MSKSIAHTFKNLKPNSEEDQLISFISGVLPNFFDSEEFKKISSSQNEIQLTEALQNFLTFSQTDNKYNFVPEKTQFGASRVDIGIYLKGGVVLYTIEAKILPTPKGKDRADHEYVYGKGGGIERFKNEKHGLDNSGNLLPHSGMIGYVKEHDFDHWEKKVNQWVLDAGWGDTEQLVKNDFNEIAELGSRHKRKGGGDIKLFHWWVYVNV